MTGWEPSRLITAERPRPRLGLRLARLACAALVVFSTGCVQRFVLNGQVRAAREGQAAVQTLHDFEIARAGALAGLSQLELLHRLVPENSEALLLLTQAWTGAAYAFLEDEYELAAQEGKRELAAYHLERTRAAHTRALHYGLELLARRARGFEQARRRAPLLESWLATSFTDPDDADVLLWTGVAWLGRVSAARDQPEVLAERYVGVALVERSVVLNERLAGALGHTTLGGYYAGMGSLQDSLSHLRRAQELTGHRSLSAPLVLAHRYYCAAGDQRAYEQTLLQILATGDVWPEGRLANTVAKRRARRYLLNPLWREDCRFAP